MNTIFNFQRAALLIRRHFIEKLSGELMFWGIAVICMMLIRNVTVFVAGFAIITCIVRTRLFFKEIHTSTYLMIPASQIEKFTVSLLYTVVYFWAMMFIAYVAGNILGTWINNLFADVFHIHPQRDIQWVVFESFNRVEMETVDSVGSVILLLLITQSLFLLGSIYFKRNGLLKTGLALAGAALFFLLVTAVEMKYFVLDAIKEMNITGQDVLLSDSEANNILGKTVKIFYCLLIPYLWLTGYIRLTEKEA
jgi:hypothetical protein